MIELLTEEKIRSPEYLRIRCEFSDLWNRLFLNKDRIDRAIFGRFWRWKKLLAGTSLKGLWFIPKTYGRPLSSELILHSNQLWMPRAWEYPWAVLNSDISPGRKVLDVGSGHSLFPLYVAWRGINVDSVDNDAQQTEMLAPALAGILGVKVKQTIGDAVSLPASDDTYDCVFCISVLEHLEEEVVKEVPVNRHARRLDRLAVREFLRVVKPGGRVVLTLDYATEAISPRSFNFEYAKDFIEEFKAHLLKPFESFEDIRFTDEKEREMRKLWAEFYPYDPQREPAASIGIILAKR